LIFVATIGANVSRLTFTTNKGNVAFICWDIAGQEKFGGLKDGYYIGTQLLMIFFDVTLRSTYKHVPNWLQDYDRLNIIRVELLIRYRQLLWVIKLIYWVKWLYQKEIDP